MIVCVFSELVSVHVSLAHMLQNYSDKPLKILSL